jgi:NAD/NADP transhydrogenase alpha subunit
MRRKGDQHCKQREGGKASHTATQTNEAHAEEGYAKEMGEKTTKANMKMMRKCSGYCGGLSVLIGTLCGVQPCRDRKAISCPGPYERCP